MRRSFASFSLFLAAALLSGCGAIGNKAASISMIYGVTAVLALLLLIGYCSISQKKDLWFLLLFTSVLVVNTGYFVLSVSRDLEEALLANRLSYLGSVFLPMSMWMIILNITSISYRKWLPGLLLVIAAAVFLIAASPGYLDIYYKEVFFERIDGVSVLKKVYGPLHGIYLIYLLGYFSAMVVTIVSATLRDKLESTSYAVILAIAVFVNIGVWMIEQLVQIDFEILSVSYIISELFLLGLRLFITEVEKQKRQLVESTIENFRNELPSQVSAETADPAELQEYQEQLELFAAGMRYLTPKEQELYECYAAGMTTAEIMEHLNIKENTLKFHNKNLYGKLGINSRKQLIKLHKLLSSDAQSRP